MVLTWNYVDRIDASGAKNSSATESRVVINTSSLKSISTNKSKSAPAGTFEIRLAPTVNWVTKLTAGSWCAILMSPQQDIPPTIDVFPGFVDPKTFKMLGRINSVRAVVNVDQATGARMTEYVITGEDWGSVFNTVVYIDPIARNNNLDTLTVPGHAALLLAEGLTTYYLSKTGLPTSSEICNDLKALWGDPLTLLKKIFSKKVPNLLFTSENQFLLPLSAAIYMKFVDPEVKLPSFNLSQLIKIVDGVLESYDKYSGDPREAYGYPTPNSLYGSNTFWQLLMDNCNSTLNELIADIRFEGNRPQLSLYKRIKPFVNRENFPNKSEVENLISPFKNIRKIKIPDEEILSINAGTNWRDKINFIEIRPQPLTQQGAYDVAVKTDQQEKDRIAFERDGFKPLIETVKYLPLKGSALDPFGAIKWRRLLREWYFNTHNMLNGAVTFIGRQEYIQVGDNIQIPARVFGAPFNVKQRELERRGNKTFVLAHVENVAHTFTVNENGARSFLTTVQFSRGVITDERGAVVDAQSGGAIDDDAEELNNQSEKNTGSVFGTSVESDPDIQKLKGR
jgi:hypothetical protein